MITVATGLAAQRGWLFRGGDVIETAAGLDRVVFDKTGTLTLGRPLVTGLWAKDAALLLQLAASLEQSSRHPPAHARLQEAQRQATTSTASDHCTANPTGEVAPLPRPPWCIAWPLVIRCPWGMPGADACITWGH